MQTNENQRLSTSASKIKTNFFQRLYKAPVKKVFIQEKDKPEDKFLKKLKNEYKSKISKNWFFGHFCEFLYRSRLF